MKAIFTIMVTIFVLLMSCSAAYAMEYQLTGSGVALSNDESPRLYQSIMRVTLLDQDITKGTFLVHGNNFFLRGNLLPQDWSFLYNKDGSFHGQGSVKTSLGEIFNVILDGNRIYATSSGSMWKVSADMKSNSSKLLLDYLVMGTDPTPAVDVSPAYTVTIPNGNSEMANKGFFVPLNSEVVRGTTVTWQNEDNIGHTIQSEDVQGKLISLFNSGILKTGDTFSYKFDKPGVYHYFCTIHPWRIGVVTVS